MPAATAMYPERSAAPPEEPPASDGGSFDPHPARRYLPAGSPGAPVTRGGAQAYWLHKVFQVCRLPQSLIAVWIA
jgi:hypothetical protein